MDQKEPTWDLEKTIEVRKGQFKWRLEMSLLDFESYMTELEEIELDPYERSKAFADKFIQAIAPHLSIRDIRCMIDALSEQYEQHWMWRNEWSKGQKESEDVIKLTDTKPFEEVNERRTETSNSSS